jgi:hypothetical protein
MSLAAEGRMIRGSRSRFAIAALVALVMFPAAPGFAQENTSFVWDVAKGVVLDPTTYVPAAASYTGQRLDWKSSQPLFEAGWLEENPRFTISGRPNDLPISYAAGNQRILTRSLEHLQWSALNNVTVGIVDRVLADRYPNHRKLIAVLSWIERISFASYRAYLGSINYFEQARENERIARELFPRP